MESAYGYKSHIAPNKPNTKIPFNNGNKYHKHQNALNNNNNSSIEPTENPQLSNNFQSIETTSSYIDKLTWPKSPLAFIPTKTKQIIIVNQVNEEKEMGIDIDLDGIDHEQTSLISSVDTNELLASTPDRTNHHQHQHQHQHHHNITNDTNNMLQNIINPLRDRDHDIDRDRENTQNTQNTHNTHNTKHSIAFRRQSSTYSDTLNTPQRGITFDSDEETPALPSSRHILSKHSYNNTRNKVGVLSISKTDKIKLNQISKSNIDYFQGKNGHNANNNNNNNNNTKLKTNGNGIINDNNKINKSSNDMHIIHSDINEEHEVLDEAHVEYPAVSSYFSSQYYDSMYPDNNHNGTHEQKSLYHHNTPNYKHRMDNTTITTQTNYRYSNDTLQTLKRDDSDSYFVSNLKKHRQSSKLKMYPMDDSIIDHRNHRYRTRHSSSGFNHLQLRQGSLSHDNDKSSSYDETAIEESPDSGTDTFNKSNFHDRIKPKTKNKDSSSRRHTDGLKYSNSNNGGPLYSRSSLYDQINQRSNVVLPVSSNKIKKGKRNLNGIKAESPRKKIERRKQNMMKNGIGIGVNNNNGNRNDLNQISHIKNRDDNKNIFMTDSDSNNNDGNIPRIRKRNSLPQQTKSKTVYISKSNQRLTRTPNVKSTKRKRMKSKNRNKNKDKYKDKNKKKDIIHNGSKKNGILKKYDLDPLNSRIPPQIEMERNNSIGALSESPPIPPIPPPLSSMKNQSIHLSADFLDCDTKKMVNIKPNNKSPANLSNVHQGISIDDVESQLDINTNSDSESQSQSKSQTQSGSGSGSGSTSMTKQTYEYDYDSDPVQPKPTSYHMNINSPLRTEINPRSDNHRQNISLVELQAIIKEPESSNLQKFALTKENIDKLNDNYAVTETSSNEESTSTDGLQSLEKIGKQLREISILTPDDDASMSRSGTNTNGIRASHDTSMLVMNDSNPQLQLAAVPMTPELHNDVTDISVTNNKTRITHLSVSQTLTPTNTTNIHTHSHINNNTLTALTNFKRFESILSNNNDLTMIPQTTTTDLPPMNILNPNDKRISITITQPTPNNSHDDDSDQKEPESKRSRTHHNTAEYLSDDYDNSVNLSSTDFDSHNLDDLPSKYLQPTPSPLATPINDILNQDLNTDISIDISSSNLSKGGGIMIHSKAIKLPKISNNPHMSNTSLTSASLNPPMSGINNRRVLPVQVQKLKHHKPSKKKKKGKTSKGKPRKQNKKHSHEFGLHQFKNYRLAKFHHKSPHKNSIKSPPQQPYINDDADTDDNTLSILMRGVLNDDDMFGADHDNYSHHRKEVPPPSSTSIAYEEEKEMGFKSTIYGGHHHPFHPKYSGHNPALALKYQATNTMTIDEQQSYASTYHRNSLELENELMFIHANQRSNYPFNKNGKSKSNNGIGQGFPFSNKNSKNSRRLKNVHSGGTNTSGNRRSSWHHFIYSKSKGSRNSQARRDTKTQTRTGTQSRYNNYNDRNGASKSSRLSGVSQGSRHTEDSTDTMPSLLIPITRPSDDEHEFLRLYNAPRSHHVKYKDHYSNTNPSNVMQDDGNNSDESDDEDGMAMGLPIDVRNPNRIISASPQSPEEYHQTLAKEIAEDIIIIDTSNGDGDTSRHSRSYNHSVNSTMDHRLSFSVRDSIAQCFNIWLIMFHLISIISYLSEGYICYTYYQIVGMEITIELMSCAVLSGILFLIYLRILVKNSRSILRERRVTKTKNSINIGMQKIKWSRDMRYSQPEYDVKPKHSQKRFWVVHGLIVSSMVNCTHFTLQFVIYIFLIITVDDWTSFAHFESYQLYLITTIIILQCICLSMTIMNIIAYLWERNHYHSQSLSFRVLCLYLDIVRIIFLIYIFWNVNSKIISSFYYFYFYVEYWMLFTLLILIRLVVICCNWEPMYRQFGFCRFLLYLIYSLIEPVFRFIIVQLFPHCCVYYGIHNIGTGKFDHYASHEKYFLFCSKNMVSIKQLICAGTMLNEKNQQENFYSNTVSRHYQLLDIFEFIENGVYEYVDEDAFSLSDEPHHEILRRILTINYQLLMNDEISKSSEIYRSDHSKLLDLNNIILYEFHKMFQLALYPLKIHDMKQNYLKNSGPHQDDTPPVIYSDLFQNNTFSKSSIFMEWFVQNELMANLHFEWNNGFIVNHPLFTTFYCKYIVTLFYIFTRITNICWLYFIIMNCVIYLLNEDIGNNAKENKLLLIYVCGIIILIQIFAHIMLLIFGTKAYKFEKSIWYLLPTLNAKYIHRLLNSSQNKLGDGIDYRFDKNGIYDKYNTENINASITKCAVDIYESFCYKHIISNHLYDNFGYDIGHIVVSFLPDEIIIDNEYNRNLIQQDNIIQHRPTENEIKLDYYE